MASFAESSIYTDTGRFNAAEPYVAPPSGVTLKTDRERTLWRQLVTSRAATDWRDIDLLQLHKIMTLELRMRDLLDRLEIEGEVIEDRLGEPKVNPVVLAITKLHQLQYRVISNMGLVSSFVQPIDRTAGGGNGLLGKNGKRSVAAPPLMAS